MRPEPSPAPALLDQDLIAAVGGVFRRALHAVCVALALELKMTDNELRALRRALPMTL